MGPQYEFLLVLLVSSVWLGLGAVMLRWANEAELPWWGILLLFLGWCLSGLVVLFGVLKLAQMLERRFGGDDE